MPSPLSQPAAGSRRGFLRRTALALAAAGIAVPGRGETAAPLRLGFLGAAHSHFKEKHRVASESADFTVVGACEEDPEVRARAPGGVRWLDCDALLAGTDVVVVESAVKHHARDAARALRAGRHVHVEKPPADSLAAFDELQRLAAEQRRLLQVGYMWRHNPGFNAVLDAARAGWLGEVFLVRATMNTFSDAAARRDWAAFAGGAMFEQGSHLVDAVVRLLGRPVKVTAFLQRLGQPADTLADNTAAILEYPRALAIITSSPRQPGAGPHRSFEVTGTNGTARLQPLEPPALVVDLARAAGPYAAGRQEVTLPPYRRYVDELAALAAAIRGGGALPVPAATERLVQETVLRAAGMVAE